MLIVHLVMVICLYDLFLTSGKDRYYVYAFFFFVNV